MLACPRFLFATTMLAMKKTFLLACLSASAVLAGFPDVLKVQGFNAASPSGFRSQGGLNASEQVQLSSVSSDDYTLLSNPRFPGHQVRVKKSSFCDPTVK